MGNGRPAAPARIPQQHTVAITILATAACVTWAAVFVLYILDETQARTDHETTWFLAFVALIISFTAIGTGVAAYIERALAESRAGGDPDVTAPILQVFPSSLGGYQTIPNREMAMAAVLSRPVPVQRPRWDTPSGAHPTFTPEYCQAYGDVAESVLEERDDDPPGAKTVQ